MFLTPKNCNEHNDRNNVQNCVYNKIFVEITFAKAMAIFTTILYVNFFFQKYLKSKQFKLFYKHRVV